MVELLLSLSIVHCQMWGAPKHPSIHCKNTRVDLTELGQPSCNQKAHILNAIPSRVHRAIKSLDPMQHMKVPDQGHGTPIKRVHVNNVLVCYQCCYSLHCVSLLPKCSWENTWSWMLAILVCHQLLSPCLSKVSPKNKLAAYLFGSAF